MAIAYDATIWVKTDLRVDGGYDEEAVDKLVYKHGIKETSTYGEFLEVLVNLDDGESFRDAASSVELMFAPLVAEQKAQEAPGSVNP